MNKLIDHVNDLIDEKEIKGVKPHIIYLGRNEYLILKLSSQDLITYIDNDRKELMGIELVLVNKQNHLKVY